MAMAFVCYDNKCIKVTWSLFSDFVRCERLNEHIVNGYACLPGAMWPMIFNHGGEVSSRLLRNTIVRAVCAQ